jgi:tryptophanyl-tRNA synthetase
MNKKKRVYSGIRATGRLHLGNYLGAVKGMLELQETHDCIFGVVDLHTITTPYNPKTLKQSVLEVAKDYLAAGLDPKKCLLMVQSMVPEHVELSYLLATIYPTSRLQQLPTYKDKILQHPKYKNLGLLYYPVLMAADILIYKAELVPVGIDQEPHLEVTREIARKFNSIYGEIFPLCYRYETEGEYVPSLLGEGKMSKSVEGSFVNLADKPKVIEEKIMSAVTDTGPAGGKLPEKGPIYNLFVLLRLLADKETVKTFEKKYLDKSLKYVELKKTLAELVVKELEPIRKRREKLSDEYVKRVLEEGSAKCRIIAKETLREVKKKMGLV